MVTILSKPACEPVARDHRIAKALSFGRLLGWVGRRMYGQPLDNAHAMAFNRRVLFATFAEAVAMVGGQYPATAIAATEVSLARIEAEALRKEICAKPEIGRAVRRLFGCTTGNCQRRDERHDGRVFGQCCDAAHTGLSFDV